MRPGPLGSGTKATGYGAWALGPGPWAWGLGQALGRENTVNLNVCSALLSQDSYFYKGFLEFQATKVRFDCVYHQIGRFPDSDVLASGNGTWPAARTLHSPRRWSG